MSIKLNGATSGSVELDVPDDIGSDVSLTIPGAAGTLDRLERAGNILQVKNSVLTTGVDLTSAANWTDVGLEVSITPTSASSKIFLLVSIAYELGASATSVFGGFRILRDSTVIYLPQTGANGALNTGISVGGSTSIYFRNTWAYHLLDTPSTTSSITYNIQGDRYFASTNAFIVNANSTTRDSSQISVMEVAA
jgi:hypothetical protein